MQEKKKGCIKLTFSFATSSIGDSPEVYDFVTRIADAAVASIPQVDEKFQKDSRLHPGDLSENKLADMNTEEY